MRDEVKNWLDFACEDLKMAELALKNKIYNQVCFHSEQCVEKVIKAIILHKGKIHPQSHKLADLLNYLGGNIFNDLEEEIILLDRFYIPTRYPDAMPGTLLEALPTEEDAQKALNTARLALDKAKIKLKRL